MGCIMHCFAERLAQAPELGANIEEEFNVTDVPENWKNESAVIIGQRTNIFLPAQDIGKKSATTVVKDQ